MLTKIFALLPLSAKVKLLVALQRFVYKVSVNLKKNDVAPDAVREIDEWILDVDKILWSAQVFDLYDPHK